MNQKIIVFEDYGNRGTQLFAAPDGTNIEDALMKAIGYAAEAGETCLRSELPEKYLTKAGLTRIDIEVARFGDGNIGLTRSEQAGIFRPECRYCDAFEGGVCWKHGGTCDPSDEDDCIHCGALKTLMYDGDFVQNFIIDDDCMSAKELAEAAKTDYENVKEIMERPDYDCGLWSLES